MVGKANKRSVDGWHLSMAPKKHTWLYSVYICICMYTYVTYIYIYIYIERERETLVTLTSTLNCFFFGWGCVLANAVLIHWPERFWASYPNPNHDSSDTAVRSVIVLAVSKNLQAGVFGFIWEQGTAVPSNPSVIRHYVHLFPQKIVWDRMILW